MWGLWGGFGGVEVAVRSSAGYPLFPGFAFYTFDIKWANPYIF
jgi:hypothetical protein